MGSREIAHYRGVPSRTRVQTIVVRASSSEAKVGDVVITSDTGSIVTKKDGFAYKDRGQVVDLIAQTAGLQVNMQGKALTAGGEGDRLIVKNTNSGKRVEGVVLASGAVLVQ